MRTGIQKITAHIPSVLLKEAQESTGLGITETIKAGLEKLAKAKVYQEIRKLRGKVKFSIDITELRKDKR